MSAAIAPEGDSSDKPLDEPFPGYHYGAAASDRADRGQEAVRKAILEHGDGALFDTEPQQIVKTLARLRPATRGESGA